MGGTVGIVFNALHFGRNTVLGALEINFAVMLLMTTANVAGGDAAEVIAATGFGLLLEERTVRLAFVQTFGDDLHHVQLYSNVASPSFIIGR